MLAAIFLVVAIAMLALAVDYGYMLIVRTEAQNAADAAALAGGQELLSEERLSEGFFPVLYSACVAASDFTSKHKVGPKNGYLRVWEDVAVGRLDDPTDRNEPMTWTGTSTCNALSVTVRATRDRNRQSPLFFASLFGLKDFNMEATATVAFADRISGFQTSPAHPNTSLLPFVVKMQDWKNLVSWGWDDQWKYNPEDGTVEPGCDGIPEMVMYPIDTGAGNWGTVDIGPSNNSTADLVRQIVEGVSDADLEAIGGSLQLDPDTGTTWLNGDTGISAGMKHGLAQIVGQARTIPLYTSCEGNGNNMNYEIAGFAGLRIVDYNMTGKYKYIRVQPAYVTDPTAVAAPWVEESYFVHQPLRLVR